ncbi:MAG: ImmA/IrrE family metallo-endopeptidase, partial [Promethearchaeia archaeon]
AKVYQRTFPLFFLEKVPKDAVHPDFRFIFGSHSTQVSPEAKKSILRIAAQRDFLIHITTEQEKSFKYDSFTISKDQSYENLGLAIREILGINYETQTSWKNEYKAFNTWRDSIESKFGILVFQLKGIDIDDLRGFCIHNRPFPIIAINRKDKPPARCFTLMHELGHILLGLSDICQGKDLLLKTHDDIEIFCNYLAGEILVPEKYLMDEDLVKSHTNVHWQLNDIEELSRKYKVSKEVILRRLLILNKATKEEYKEFKKITASYRPSEPSESGSSGFNWYRGYISRHSHYYIEKLINKLDKGEISLIDASLNSNVKINNIHRLAKEYNELYG